MRRVMTVGVCAAALAVLAAPTARADVVYNNFGAGDSYQTGIGWTIGNPPGSGTFWEQGDPFVVSGNYTLSQVTAAAGWVTGPNVYTLWLMNDAGGQPGSVIEEFDFANLGTFGGTNPNLVGVSQLNPKLGNGRTYWLVATTDMSTWSAWNWNNTNDVGAHAQRTNGGAWIIVSNSRGAYRIEGNPVGGPIAAEPRGTGQPMIEVSEEETPSGITVIGD